MNLPNQVAETGRRHRFRQMALVVGERVVAIALALLLLRSSFAHLGNPYYFLSTVYSYQLTGIEPGKWVAIVLPFLQLIVGICLLLRWWPIESYLLAIFLFLGFTTVQVIAWYNGLEIACGCFGTSGGLQVGRQTVTLATSAAAASLLGLMLSLIYRHWKRTLLGWESLP